MLEPILKVLATSVIVVAVSEAAKRSALLGALIASLPLTSILAMIWLWSDTRDAEKVAGLATGIFWLVLPSLAFFVALPLLLRAGWGFIPSLVASMALTALAYAAMLAILKHLGVEI
jgi:F0F1-type ATP synthase assembly protein I